MSKDQRIVVLGDLDESWVPRPLISLLINKDPEVYKRLLESKALSRLHLEPLAGIPDGSWADLAMVALEAGNDAQSIAEAAFSIPGITVSWGPESSRLSQWEEAFSRLEGDPRNEIREITHHGRQRAQALILRAKEREHHEEIYGT